MSQEFSPPPAPISRCGRREPALSEVLADPVVHQVMRRDGVTKRQLCDVIARAQAVLRSRDCRRCAA